MGQNSGGTCATAHIKFKQKLDWISVDVRVMGTCRPEAIRKLCILLYMLATHLLALLNARSADNP